MLLRRYWFEFQFTISDPYTLGTLLGAGVTASSHEDALRLLRERVFSSCPMPPIKKIVEDVSIESLDQNHVRPNMGDPTLRGVWFPLGYG
jgi:hypothetical protein